jgi:hypothetical protein
VGTRETYHNTLLRACILVGDETHLAQRLHVPVPTLVQYLLGEVPIPNELFLKAVDIVLPTQQQRVTTHRKMLDELHEQVALGRKMMDEIRERHRAV